MRGRGGSLPKPATSEPVITDPAESKPATSEPVITDPAPKASSCEPYRELIERYLADGRLAMSIWQELVEKRGFKGRYGFRNFQNYRLRVRALCG